MSAASIPVTPRLVVTTRSTAPPSSAREQVLGEAQIRRALEDRAFAIVFQPVVDLRTGLTAGAEALARFSALPYRTPDLWFGAAERCGLGLELELAAVEDALRRLPDVDEGTYIAVNVAPRTMLSAELRDLLAGRDGARIVLELTEHARVDHYGPLQSAIAFFRSRGFRLAIDDAGSGHSSLQHILELRPDIIKLDRALTTGLDSNPVRLALASAIVTFGASLGACVCAEGIETAQELVALQRLGIHYGQGYFLGRPAPLPLAPAPSGLWFAPRGSTTGNDPSPFRRDPGVAASPAVRSPARIDALHASGLMDDEPEPQLDRLTRLAARLLDAPVALLTLVDGHRVFYKSRVGSDIRESPIGRSFCAHVVTSSSPLVIHDASTHPLVRDNPVVKERGVRFYAGLPVKTADGQTLGSLCVVDWKPRTLSPEDLATLTDLAAAASAHIDEKRRADEAERRQRVDAVLLDCTASGILVCDRELRIVRANDALCAMMGRTREQLLGQPLSFAKESDDLQATFALRDALMSGRISEVTKDVRYLRPDGTPFWIRINARLVRDPGGRPEVFVFATREVAVPKQVG